MFGKKKTTSAAATSGKAPVTGADGVTRVDIDRTYKMMIYTSFAVNVILFVVLIFLGFQLFILKNGLPPLKGTIGELMGAIDDLQTATIIADVPLDTRLPINLQVPVSQATMVRVTQPVPLQVPAAIVFPGGGGNLNASVSLNLPEGLELPVYLSMTIPLESSVPVSLTVPVNIPLSETELAPAFGRLKDLVQPLADLVNGEGE